MPITDDPIDFEVVIDNPEILKAIVDESKTKTLSIMETGLKSYLKKTGKDSTFEGWIAHDYPENSDVDKRLTTPFNDWRLVWNKTYNEHFKSKTNPLFSLLHAKSIRSTKRNKYPIKLNKKHSKHSRKLSNKFTK